MTNQQLKNLIANGLGPIVDAAARLTERHPRLIDEYLHHREQLALGKITQQEFGHADDRLWARLNLDEQLAFLVQLAREDGHLAPAPAYDRHAGPHETQIATRDDQDWPALLAR